MPGAVNDPRRIKVGPYVNVALPPLLLLLCLLPYLHALSFPFQFDDLAAIVENAGLRVEGWSPADLRQVLEQSPSALHYRPVSQLSFLVSYRLGGDSPAAFRLVNFLLHWCNAVLVYALGLALASSLGLAPGRLGPFLGALLWAVHPVQTQAVTYVVQRATLLAASFGLLSVLFFLKGRSASSGPYQLALRFAAFGSFLLAVGSKESAAVLPVIILILEAALRVLEGRRLFTPVFTGSMAVVCLVGVMLWVVFGGPANFSRPIHGKGFNSYERFLSQGRVQGIYLSLLAWPDPGRFSIDRDLSPSRGLTDPPSTLVGWILVLSAALGSGLAARSRPFLSLAILWFLAAQVVEASPLPLDLVHEHRLYFPSILPGLWMGGWLSARILKPEKAPTKEPGGE